MNTARNYSSKPELVVQIDLGYSQKQFIHIFKDTNV